MTIFQPTEVRVAVGLYKYIATLDEDNGWFVERFRRYKDSAKLECGTLYNNGWHVLRLNSKGGDIVYFKTLEELEAFIKPQRVERLVDFLTLPAYTCPSI